MTPPASSHMGVGLQPGELACPWLGTCRSSDSDEEVGPTRRCHRVGSAPPHGCVICIDKAQLTTDTRETLAAVRAEHVCSGGWATRTSGGSRPEPSPVWPSVVVV